MSVAYTQRPETKIWTGGDGSFAFGLSGAEPAFQLLRSSFRSMELAGKSVDEVRGEILSTALAAFLDHYGNLQAIGVQVKPELHGASAVLGTIIRGEPWLFQVNEHAQVTDHVARRFVSIGSGRELAEHAITVFRDIRDHPRFGLFHGQVLAFRVIRDAIAIGGPGAAIGGPVQMATIVPDGIGARATLLRRDDPMLDDQVAHWKTLEAENFVAQEPP